MYPIINLFKDTLLNGCMKLRQKPDDFIVEEIVDRQWKDSGKFAIYKVSKVGMTTFAAEKVLAMKCGVKFNKIGFAGLKDAHARTVQYFSVETDTPEKGVFKEQNVSSELVGFADEPLKTGGLVGNKFIITIRQLKEHYVFRAKKNLEIVKQGVPNYFDTQRFGSLMGVEGFIAKDILKGDYESAVKKVVTATNRHQKATVRRTKKFVAAHWGDWEECLSEIQKNKLDRTSDGTIIAFLLLHPEDFKGAFQLTFKGIRELFFSAYQSFIWNECIKTIVRQHSNEVFSVEYRAGKLVFARSWRKVPEGQFPMIAGDIRCLPEQMRILKDILQREKINIEEFFTTEHMYMARLRDILVVPKDLSVEFSDDEVNTGQKAVLSFFLQKGSYATVITKALFEE